jgi:hypothetical protein
MIGSLQSFLCRKLLLLFQVIYCSSDICRFYCVPDSMHAREEWLPKLATGILLHYVNSFREGRISSSMNAHEDLKKNGDW